VNRPAGWAAAFVLLAATAALVAVTPTDMNTPFELTGRVGDRIQARLAEVEVLDVRLTDRLDVTYEDDVDGTTEGVWVIVDAIVTPTMGRLSLDGITLRIGGTTYGTAQDILGFGSMLTQPYGPGVTQQGTMVFELPRSALDAAPTATIVFALSPDPRLDSLPAVVVDLAGLDVLPSVDIGQPFVPEDES
jgi:hypothetical protein